MAIVEDVRENVDLSEHGLTPRGRVFTNPTTALLYIHTILKGDGTLAEGGPLAVDTGHHTGRSPNDKFVVREVGSEDRIWWSKVNQDLEPEHFEGLRTKVVSHLEGQDLYVVDAFAGADPAHRGLRARGARPPCARRRGRPGDGPHPQRDLRRPPPDKSRGADRRHLLRRRDQEVHLHPLERPASA